jgi:hypothetical protein
VHHLFDPTFADKFRKIVEGRYKRYGYFEYDTESEIERYKVRFFSARGARAARTYRRCCQNAFFIESRTSIGISGKTAAFRY